jgi:hypothetical protein
MTPIPDEIMEQARALRGAVLWESNSSIEQIARVIYAERLAAEKRGEERERERCAKVAEKHRPSWLSPNTVYLRRQAETIAAAIRSGT